MGQPTRNTALGMSNEHFSSWFLDLRFGRRTSPGFRFFFSIIFLLFNPLVSLPGFLRFDLFCFCEILRWYSGNLPFGFFTGFLIIFSFVLFTSFLCPVFCFADWFPLTFSSIFICLFIEKMFGLHFINDLCVLRKKFNIY